MTTKEKLLDISLLLGTAAAVLISSFAGFAKDCDALRDNTFRLHILAASDSEKDQKIKYALRDCIISDFGELFAGCTSKEDSAALAERELPMIEERANGYLKRLGCDEKAVCTVENAAFPTRSYGDTTLPAGRYDALRIVIGNGEGQNWWCVLYPSVCVGAASASGSVFPRRTIYEQRKAADRSTADSLKAQRGQIEFRFALYDIIKQIFGV